LGSGPLLCMAGYLSLLSTRNQLNNGPPQCIPQFKSRECTSTSTIQTEQVNNTLICCCQHNISILWHTTSNSQQVHSLLSNCGMQMHCGGPLFNWFLVPKWDEYPAMQSNGPLPHKLMTEYIFAFLLWAIKISVSWYAIILFQSCFMPFYIQLFTFYLCTLQIGVSQ